MSEQKQKIWAWLFAIFGGIAIWGSLVELATHQDPIFGNLSNHDPKWAAVGVVMGIVFLVSGFIWIDRLMDGRKP